MSKVCLTPFEYAMRDVGVREVKGALDNPYILAMLRLDSNWPEHDEVPWCSAWMNWICHRLRLPRSKSLAARSWLDVGIPVGLDECRADSDIVILARSNSATDPAIRHAPGHVGFFAGMEATQNGARVELLAGNQGNAVSIAHFDVARVIGCRRLN